MIDKASLIQIPSGYKNGKLYSVKPTPTYGSELAVNGDFATDSDWTKGSGWSIVNGEAVHTGSGNYIEQGSLVQGKNYRVVIVVTQASTSGFPQIYMGGLTTAMPSPNTYTFDITAQSGDKIKLRGLNDCKVDSISVKEILVADGDFDFSRSSSGTRVNSEGLIETAKVLGTTEEVTNGDFSSGGNWSGSASISNGQLTKTGGGLAYQDISGVSGGGLYKIVVDVQLSVASLRLYVGGTQVDLSQGVNTLNVTSRGSNNFIGFNNGYDSGTSTGSVINSISVIQYIENDIPRLDYSDGSCASLLLEPQRTNLITYSESSSGIDFNNVNSITSNSGISPDGTNNAIGIDADSGDVLDSYKNSGANTVTTFSVFLKSGSNDVIELNPNSTGSSASVGFNLTIGTITYTSGSQYLDSSIKDFGNGWYRCSVTYTSGTGAFINRITSLSTGTFKIFGLQLEAGSYPTSYIPTSGSTVTRTADVCNNAGTSATFNDSEGVLYAEVDFLTLTGGDYFGLNDGTNNQRVLIQRSTNNIRAYINSAVELTATISSLNNKIAVSYKANDYKLYLNGTKVATNTSSSVTPSGLNAFEFELGGGFGLYFYGKVKQLIVFNEALSDSELQALTS